MFRAILFQVGAGFFASLASALFFGVHGAVSAALGALICLLPNALFALRLSFAKKRSSASYPANFFIGEIVKILAIVGLLFVVIKGYADLHWPSLLIGMGLALQAGYLAFWKKS